jgi:hypothetical protein
MNPVYIIILTGRRDDTLLYQIATDTGDEYHPVYEVKDFDNSRYREKISSLPATLEECKRRLRVLHERLRP